MDLRFTAQVLVSLAAAREGVDLSPPEHELASRCDAWALKLRQIARQMEEATS